MKSWLIISLLLSSFIIHEAQGMSFRRGSLAGQKYDIHRKIVSLKRNSYGVEDDEGMSIFHQIKKFSGRSRKLTASLTSSTTKTAKNVKNIEEDKDLSNSEGSNSNKEKIGKKGERLSVNYSSSLSQEVYPDVMDIAGMDYSQARRRSPIHN
ncbi:uncharacterized protein LOC142544579 [Primulina tabacum]|uniref:uncharacterized protein LOC142544579 n=1 Tax=Primulina tabacum TaxID=48773 RepID=UPI003F5A4D9B